MTALNIGLIIAAVFAVLVIVYFLMIMPRMTGKPDTEAFMHHLYAHRGLFDNESDAPENSMKAFKKAVDAGFGIEMDIQLTKDGQMVVFHDWNLKRMCGVEGKVCEYTFEELQQFSLLKSEEKIPLFTEVLKLIDGKVPLIIEIKIHENADVVCSKADELIREYKGVYCIESFHPFAVKWYKKNRPEVIRGQLSSDFSKPGKKEKSDEKLVHYLLTNFLSRPDFIAYDHLHKKNLSRLLCRYLYGSLSVAWTIKSQKQLDQSRKDFDLFIFEGFLPEEK